MEIFFVVVMLLLLGRLIRDIVFAKKLARKKRLAKLRLLRRWRDALLKTKNPDKIEFGIRNMEGVTSLIEDNGSGRVWVTVNCREEQIVEMGDRFYRTNVYKKAALRVYSIEVQSLYTSTIQK